jgi:hypothetical protein
MDYPAVPASSVHGNVDTCLQIVQYRIDLAVVQAPAAAVEYARRLAQRGMPLTALLRAYRVGRACFTDWLRNRSAVRAALIRDLLGERIDVSAAKATLECSARWRAWPPTSTFACARPCSSPAKGRQLQGDRL